MKLGKLGLFCILSLTAVLSVFAADKNAFHFTSAEKKLDMNFEGAEMKLGFTDNATRDKVVTALKAGKTATGLDATAGDQKEKVAFLNGVTLEAEVKANKLTLTFAGAPSAEAAAAAAAPAGFKLNDAATPSTLDGTAKFTLSATNKGFIDGGLPCQVVVTDPVAIPASGLFVINDKKVYGLKTVGTDTILFVGKAGSTTPGAANQYLGYAVYLGTAIVGIIAMAIVFPMLDAEGYRIGKETSGILPDSFKDMLPGADDEFSEDEPSVTLPDGRKVPANQVQYDAQGNAIAPTPATATADPTGTAEVAMAALFVLPFLL